MRPPKADSRLAAIGLSALEVEDALLLAERTET